MEKRVRGTIRIIDGKLSGKKIFLLDDSMYVGRPDPSDEWSPQVDLTPDYQVSRRHAHLFLKDGKWYLEDSGSKHGTFVDGKKIKGTTLLFPDQVVRMGDTAWALLPPDYQFLEWKGITMEFQLVPAISLALYRSNIPPISDFTIRNKKKRPSQGLNISIRIPKWSRVWKKDIGPLAPEQEFSFSKVYLDLIYEKLEGYESARSASLEITVNGDRIFSHEIQVLGVYQWPYESSFRKTLACFVQPAHPVVEHLAMEVLSLLNLPATLLLYGEEGAGPESVLRALYNNLRKYKIHYLYEKASAGSKYQMLRPPHNVIPRPLEREGEGTCIDLVLLFASVLENLHLQPLILLVKENDSFRHALLGLWRDVSPRFEPVMGNYERLDHSFKKGGLVLLETTGVTNRFSHRPSYEEAKVLANAQFTDERFLFALDVAACRQTITPIEFPMSPRVIAVLRKAHEMARKEGSPLLETRYLLLALLFKVPTQLLGVLKRTGSDLDKAGGLFTQKGEKGKVYPNPTINYRRVLEDARIIAGDCGVTFVEEQHLFYALLLSQSQGIDRIFQSLGTSREAVKDAFEIEMSWSKEIVQTYYEGLP